MEQDFFILGRIYTELVPCTKGVIITFQGLLILIRVESGLDNPDNLGHSLVGQGSGSHPQTKLSGFDPDITCSLGQCWHLVSE